MAGLLERARTAWAGYAGVDGAFRPGQITLAVNPSTRICPPGGCGIVRLGNAAVITAPDGRSLADLRGRLARITAPGGLDAAICALTAGRAPGDIVGPADLAFTDHVSPAPAGPAAPPRPAAPLSPAASLSPAATRSPEDPGGPQAMPVTDPRIATLISAAAPAEAAEAGLDGITSPAWVVLRNGQAAAACGWTAWPGGIAHLAVLAAPAWRGQGLAQQAARAATAAALRDGLLAQWRARVPASIAVAARLGFSTVGWQLSLRVTWP
jgi:GNAT superfamily N-acetyltransferase